jgi:hypothetical protein
MEAGVSGQVCRLDDSIGARTRIEPDYSTGIACRDTSIPPRARSRTELWRLSMLFTMLYRRCQLSPTTLGTLDQTTQTCGSVEEEILRRRVLAARGLISQPGTLTAMQVPLGG